MKTHKRPPFVDLRDDSSFFEPPGGFHRVDIVDPDALAIAHLFLPADGTRIRGDDLAERLSRLVEAANQLKKLRGATDTVRVLEKRIERAS